MNSDKPNNEILKCTAKIKYGMPTTIQEWDDMARHLMIWLKDEKNDDLEAFANEYFLCSFFKLEKNIPPDSYFADVFDLALGTLKRRRSEIYSKTNILTRADIWKETYKFYDQHLLEFLRKAQDSRKSINVITTSDKNEECRKESELIKAIMMTRNTPN